MSTKGSTMRKSYNTYYKDSYDYDDGYYHNNYYYGYNSYRGRGRYYSNKYHPHHYHDNSYHHQNYYHDNSNHSPAQPNSTSNSDSSNSKTPPTNNTPPIENKETTQNNANNTPPTVNDTTPIVTAIKSETQTPNNENINKNENITTTPIVTNNSKTTNATTTTSNSTNSIPQSRRLSVQELLGSVTTTTTPPINNEEVKKEYSRVSVQDILKSTQQSVNNEQTIQNNNIKPSEQSHQDIKPPKESIENNSIPIPAIPPQTVTEEIKTCENSEEIKKDNFTPLKDIQLPKLNVNSPSYQPKVMQTPLQQPLQMLSLNSPEKEMPNGLITQIAQLFKFYDRENCGYLYIEDAFSAIIRFLPTVPPGKVENELYSYECILLPVLIDIIKNLIGSTN